MRTSETMPTVLEVAGEIPFARRAREQGRTFTGGKPDGKLFRPN
jgi:hypothetical protein